MTKISGGARPLTMTLQLRGWFGGLWSASVPLVDIVPEAMNEVPAPAVFGLWLTAQTALDSVERFGGDSPLRPGEQAPNQMEAAKMSLRRVKRRGVFDWLLSDLCCRFRMRIGALGQVPTFAP
jgi:hypothetical protein